MDNELTTDGSHEVVHVPHSAGDYLLPAEAAYTNDPLWQRIEALNLYDPAAIFSFSKKLAKENTWTPALTQLAISEYKRFIYLCCISPQGASPSPMIDKVWHLHLTYSQHYWETLCKETLARPLHHHPSGGGPGEDRRHHDWYAATLRLYAATFGEPPPKPVWSTATRTTKDTSGFMMGVTVIIGLIAIVTSMLFSGCSRSQVGVSVGAWLLMLAIAVFGEVAVDVPAPPVPAGSKGSNDGGSSGCGAGGCGGGGCGGGGCGGGGCGG